VTVELSGSCWLRSQPSAFRPRRKASAQQLRRWMTQCRQPQCRQVTATVPTAAVPTATVSRPQSPQPLSASQESADIGVLIACAAACMPWSNPGPDNGPLSRSDKILLKDHDCRLAYRCAMCRGKSCSMALTRAQCQRRAASRDAGLYAQWQMGSRVRDLIITPVWHMRPVLAVGRTSFGTVAPVEHFEILCNPTSSRTFDGAEAVWLCDCF